MWKREDSLFEAQPCCCSYISISKKLERGKLPEALNKAVEATKDSFDRHVSPERMY
jgi:hypothetical protein